MPKLEISYEDLCMLVGKRLPKDRLDDDLLFAKSELDSAEGDTLKIDCKDTNRPDLWSTEGVAREIAGRYGKSGLPQFRLRKGKEVVLVDTKSPIQPVAVCAIARNLKISKNFLSQIIQLQEKLSVAFGRNRKEMSMGIYDMDKISFPVKYTSAKKGTIRFVPLGYQKIMSVEEILREHPKGKEFGHLMQGCEDYPLWVDSNAKILSMPPIINSNDIGNVTEKTRNVFIECTGYDTGFLKTAIDVVAAQMADRGASVETVTTQTGKSKIITPAMGKKTFTVNPDYINSISGLGLDKKTIAKLLEMARYRCKISKKVINLEYPSYRQDIMHPRDVVEDVIISYGYNNIEPSIKEMYTRGKLDEMHIFMERVKQACIGLGLQEIMSFVLSNKNDLFRKMNLEEEKTVEIENPMSQNWSVFRTSLMPNILEFFSSNMHIEYPQQIFEVGTAVQIDEAKESKTSDRTMLSLGYTASTVNYELISSYLDALMRNLGIKYSLRKTKHPSFINGRCAEIIINGNKTGILGELHPSVLNSWKLEKPVLIAEIDLSCPSSIR